MPTYIFFVHDRGETHEGIAQGLPDLKAARREAVRTLTEIANEELQNDGDSETMWVRVEDDLGTKLLVASLQFEITKS